VFRLSPVFHSQFGIHTFVFHSGLGNKGDDLKKLLGPKWPVSYAKGLEKSSVNSSDDAIQRKQKQELASYKFFGGNESQLLKYIKLELNTITTKIQTSKIIIVIIYISLGAK